MRLTTNLFFGLSILFIYACGQEKLIIQNNSMDKLDTFKKKEKFIEDNSIFYPGIADSTLKPILTEKINLAADDFISLTQSGKATEEDFQDKIKIGLKRFSNLYLNLDTEDRERICHYFEELMDIVGLENSGGHLNNFMYNFESL